MMPVCMHLLDFDSLVPSDHDRIDWGALANPENEEEEES